VPTALQEKRHPLRLLITTEKPWFAWEKNPHKKKKTSRKTAAQGGSP